MRSVSSAEAFARASSALVSEHDLTDILATLLADAVGSMNAQAGGILLVLEDSRMELLAATSHAAQALELFQLQEESGPCIDAVRSAQVVSVTGAEAIADRWSEVGAAILAAGHTAVRAYPMHWRGTVVGAMNIFFDHDPQDDTDQLHATGQAFADIATLVIVTPDTLSPESLQERTRAALTGRTIVERAKGVIAYREDINVETAYQRLRDLAREHGITLTAICERVLAAASQGRSEY